MANWVKVGNKFINLDRVDEVRDLGRIIELVYTGIAADPEGTERYNTTVITNEREAEALRRWLGIVATDLVEQMEQAEKEERAQRNIQRLRSLAFAFGVAKREDIPENAPTVYAYERFGAECEAHIAECDLTEWSYAKEDWASAFWRGVMSE